MPIEYVTKQPIFMRNETTFRFVGFVKYEYLLYQYAYTLRINSQNSVCGNGFEK